MSGKVIPILVIIFGVLLLIYTWKPILEWNLLIKPNLIQKQTAPLSPITDFQADVFGQGDNNLQTKGMASGNFGQKDEKLEFALTIEKLGITRAKVVTGDNFKTQLAHLPQSAKLGDVGNMVISGHSSLPQFFLSTNYLTIFSKLYLLETGDKVVLEKGWASYTYVISDLLVVKPSDVWVLKPPEPFSPYLTLLTCGVGGFSAERIVVRATLQDSQDLI